MDTNHAKLTWPYNNHDKQNLWTNNDQDPMQN